MLLQNLKKLKEVSLGNRSDGSEARGKDCPETQLNNTFKDIALEWHSNKL